MKRILSVLATFALTSGLSTAALAEGPLHAAGHAMSSAGSKIKHETHLATHTCSHNMHWVNGYTKHDGTKVAGYCRR